MLMSVETSQSEEEGGGIVVFWQGVHWESNAIWKAGDSVGLSLWEGARLGSLSLSQEVVKAEVQNWFCMWAQILH